eukprot:CAMPEP_0114345090 /NCGR_PEP_ID=MMETSP0101-20121206/11941_1 /TAXON_ID=38822 ORGANISM="Pteridomonas danica, Strain PT" /NCGR_SAMPLE_ID=MMETSP0101 /ASSEMBLY_ACC=CAM_ASM_000211 /LENGTH=35 /DNA_ID= /DNA_START= /DNA_END= /DNA_ORIENTATION=
MYYLLQSQREEKKKKRMKRMKREFDTFFSDNGMVY